MLSKSKFSVVVFLSLLVFNNMFCVDEQKNLWVIDRIIVLVNGVRILKSDLDRPRISKDGAKYDLDELIREELLVQKAVDRHLIPSEADIERQIVAFKLQNGLGEMTEAEFEEELKQFGFSTREYKSQIGRLMASGNVTRMEVVDKIVITSQDVEAYYKNNPEYTPEEYHLKMIPVDKEGRQNRDGLVDLGWVKKEDLDPKFEFVLKMQKGEISEMVNVNDKDYVVEVADKKERRLKTLDERYQEIERMLMQQKQDKLVKRFEEDLKKNSTITYL
jgi:peptidyl-prolyl cis-trans isomerase SurA